MSGVVCPDCGTENLQGETECISCSAPLVEFDHSPDRSERNALISDRVSALDIGQPPTVDHSDSVRQAIETMRNSPDGSVLVLDGGRLVGIVTERDVLYRVMHSGMDLERALVSSIMTPDPVRVRVSDSVAAAFNKMSVGGFRHVPVLDGELVVGQLTMKTLLRYLSRKLN
ncbi:MAG: CBS domain-containing protein [Armatimonadetes bacterium]|nr:CBS domain-containing protein [Armatimonadota bacterium]